MEVSLKTRLTLPHFMGRQISIEILPRIAPEDTLLCSLQPLCLFHSFINCLGALREPRKYFYEAAFERGLHGQAFMGFKELKCYGDPNLPIL